MTQQSRPWLPYLLLVFALLLLALSSVLKPVEDLLSVVIAPVERGFSSLIDVVGSLFKTVRDVRDLQQQVEELQSTNDALRVENIRLQEQYVAENQQLRDLLNFQSENPTYTLIGADIVERSAEVVGQDTNPYLRYLIINVGSRDGVAVGMPVVGSGVTLVGRVARVTPNLAYVQLITDPTSRVSVILQRSRVSGVVEGREDGSLVMTEILPDEEVEENEIVISSGLGGLLPKGLVLGQVESVSYQESALFQEAILRPALDFRRLEVVVVIMDFERPPIEQMEEEQTE
ncbi:MAG: rod shape-determining protein MreC [Anaerolineae bacterium]|jgi:rod shape-determining protein MreC|nr:rod shape-determining protein MreC [Anaerolineae bacterium]